MTNFKDAFYFWILNKCKQLISLNLSYLFLLDKY